MPSRLEIAAELEREGIIAVVRARSAAQAVPLAEALLRGGMRAIEITLTTPDAVSAIRDCAAKFGTDAVIGSGTVLTAADAERTIEAGARFVVTPITRAEIARTAHAAGFPVMLGAYTPTEMQTAFEAGADFIKLFPADTLGPSYIKAVRAPLPHLKIVPTGGVTLENIGEFLKAGCPAAGIGSSLISRAILETNDWPELTRAAQAFVQAVRAARNALAPSGSAGKSLPR